MNRTNELPILLIGAAGAEFVALLITFLCAGGGHGTYVAAKLLFPYSMALTGVTGEITTPLLILAFAQFPVYAIAVWPLRKRIPEGRWLVLVFVHALGVAAAFAMAAPTFTP